MGHWQPWAGRSLGEGYSYAVYCTLLSLLPFSTSWNVNVVAMLTTQPAWDLATQPGPHVDGATG